MKKATAIVLCLIAGFLVADLAVVTERGIFDYEGQRKGVARRTSGMS